MTTRIPDLKPGQVALVGAGPGDPDLLTRAAERILRQATDVVYDRLVSDAILALVPPEATLHYAGKRSHCHALTQSQTNALLARLAMEGRKVVRLKGGDPFVFGRGGEEQDYLSERGIETIVVPGLTSALGCATLNGLPLTHRECSQMLTLVTGHLKQGELDLDWRALSSPNQTVVFYMGLSNAARIRDALIKAGRSPKTPVALIERGATPQERRCITTLSQLPESVEQHGLQPPTLIIVGDVVNHVRDFGQWLTSETNIPEVLSCAS